jgi:SAM-dependent methyltransferase
MADLEAYRASESEKERTADLLRVLPKGRNAILDIGAREGFFSKLLTDHFNSVTALDLQKPTFDYPRVVTVAGDVRHLEFPDDAFDCVFCAEVLEHVPEVTKACREIVRVARHEIVIGVPFKQDIRIGRATCVSCGKVNPPWGHVNSFDEKRLLNLFADCKLISTSFVGTTREATNPLSAALMDFAGNPWGTYDEDANCLHCGARLCAPVMERTLGSKICSALAHRTNQLQAHWIRPHSNWIHLVLSKPQPPAHGLRSANQ